MQRLRLILQRFLLCAQSILRLKTFGDVHEGADRADQLALATDGANPVLDRKLGAVETIETFTLHMSRRARSRGLIDWTGFLWKMRAIRAGVVDDFMQAASDGLGFRTEA